MDGRLLWSMVGWKNLDFFFVEEMSDPKDVIHLLALFMSHTVRNKICCAFNSAIHHVLYHIYIISSVLSTYIYC